MNKTHAYVHRYLGYHSDGGKCRIRIYRGEDEPPVVVCTQQPDNPNTSVTNMTEHLAAEAVEGHSPPLVWVEHYPEHEGKIEEWSRVGFSSWEAEEMLLGGVWRRHVGSPLDTRHSPCECRM